MRRPGLLGLGRRLDARLAVLAHPAQQVGDELDVLLDATRQVAEGRRIVRADQGQHVGEARDVQAEIGVRTVGPLVPELRAV